jgi:3-dehydroquinate synthetase
MGVLRVEDAERILTVQRALGLPMVRDEITVEMLGRGIQDARKHRGGRLRMPVLSGIGQVIFIDEVSQSQLLEALTFIRAWDTESALEARQSA